MELADLSKTSVDRAVIEHDEIGREAFLEKYGYGRSRSYFVVFGGLAYDSKAICGAAHGYLGEGSSPLSAAAFSGGRDAAALRLG